jgi:protein-S-isoprenylcysteine O-methyltransferase Ste14
VRSLLETFALFGCAVYATIPCFWFTVHPFTRHWRSRGRDAYKTILPLWFVYIVAAMALLWPWRTRALYDSPVAFLPGAVFILLGVFFYVAASHNFSHVQLSGLAELEPGRHADPLVTTGIRSRVRHPIYLGHFCELLGWSIAFGTISLIALTLFAAITGVIMLRLEDRELEQRFGESYAEYRRTVPAILPRIF